MLGVQSRRVVRGSLLGGKAVCGICVELYRLVLELMVTTCYLLLVLELNILRATVVRAARHVACGCVAREALGRMGLVGCSSDGALSTSAVLLV